MDKSTENYDFIKKEIISIWVNKYRSELIENTKTTKINYNNFG